MHTKVQSIKIRIFRYGAVSWSWSGSGSGTCMHTTCMHTTFIVHSCIEHRVAILPGMHTIYLPCMDCILLT